MQDISFDEFLKNAKNGVKIEICSIFDVMKSGKLAPHVIKPRPGDWVRVSDKLNFFRGLYEKISEYPECEKMIVDAAHKYERTGAMFDVYYNYCEYPDGEIPEDFEPIGIFWLP